ncbi:hypothetical protein [Collimonas sp.]|jgi:hypothetical protein|uniref:hypothetical protein n=1 Tax=Collimonas sp. TaxID=1963772 RepID=UPI002BE149E0|nr:hypothetical protein [Collimonas sp.]HWW05968.1 hypothetical protein [Collimonas sp.]
MIPSHSPHLSPVAPPEAGQHNPPAAAGKFAPKAPLGIFNKLAAFNFGFLTARLQAFAPQHQDHSHRFPAGGPDAAGHIDKHQFTRNIFSLASARLRGHEQDICRALKEMERTLGAPADWSESHCKDADNARRALAEAGRKNALALIGCSPSDDAAAPQQNAGAHSEVEKQPPAALPSEIEQQQQEQLKKNQENVDSHDRGQDRAPDRSASRPPSQHQDGAAQ